ncbi:hypothetical protein [Paractinoplanes rishiriensis]|uniref:Uncharacterized protein n=1 Tax=Paractinoplanes rishiriensis TaxID=1050105 RepID=A0A919JT22_9ACTN|nr:hypothetical protein [Actinoplanes rishiriensis]GIE92837.1 hypothetical protein Ari01nite_03020 [Actinoplanes rishiriensis]
MTNEEQRAARLFDVRRVIGGLFVIYGVIVGLIGLFDSPGELDKAQGVRINLWMGLAMLVFGLLMLLWLRLNPPSGPARPDEEGPTGPAAPDEDRTA